MAQPGPSDIPSTHRAIVLTGPNPGGKPKYSLDTVPTPIPVSGQALVRVLCFGASAGLTGIFSGSVPYLRHWPLVPGGACIGRVEAVGNDALILRPGQLVFLDSALHGRDDPDQKAVLGMFQGFPSSERLGATAWRNGSLAEKVLVPLESLTLLDEDVLVNKRGYTIERIYLAKSFVLPYEGYRLANFVAGDTVIVAWASGMYGNAACELALAMGAGRLIALGRDMSKLEAWAKPLPPHLRSRVRLFSPTNDIVADSASLRALTPRGKGADIFIDLSPAGVGAAKEGPVHIKSCIGAMALKGRAVFLGYFAQDVPLPYFEMIAKDLRIYSAFMYEPDAPRKVFRLLETGLLDLSEERGYTYKVYEGLEKAEEALDDANASKVARFSVLIRP